MITIVKNIGKGGFGETFLVRDAAGKEYIMKRSLKNNDAEIKKQYDNIRCLNLVRSKYFIKPHEISPKHDYFLMEYLRNYQTLSDTIQKNTLTVSQKKTLANRLIDATRTLHKVGFAHKDIKPANIMVHKDTLKLIDFGLSCFLDECHATTPGGTYAYMPPEMLDNFNFTSNPVTYKKKLTFHDYKTYDLWALGMTILSMMGKNPLLKDAKEAYKKIPWPQIEKYNRQIQKFLNDPSLSLLVPQNRRHL